MAFKLALTAGHHLYTSGKRCMKAIDPNETAEWWLNDRIADRIQLLLADYEDIEILRTDDTTGKSGENLTERTNKANAFGADFYLSIHHNAGIGGGSGGGIQAYAYIYASEESLIWQKELYNELVRLTGLKGNRSQGCPTEDFHEVRETYMPAVLLELGFMDSATDVPIILSQDYAYKCAQACVNVIVKRAGLKKKANAKPAEPVGTYKVVTEINRYTTVADAIAKTNSKGKYEAGTYYIFNAYPNGHNGMYNITKDTTGSVAGSWINPAENVAPVPEEVVQKLYRVRTSWDDAKSQKGAYSVLENAKECCQSAGAGYKVFDWNGKEVYAYTAPASTPVEEKPAAAKAVYELDYPEKHQIIEYDMVQTEGINEQECTRAIVAITKNNPNFDPDIAKAFFMLADEYYIDPMRAIAQSILETGWFKFAGSSVKAEQHNYCGLGAVGGGASGAAFDTILDGVRAQLQHLYAYGCKDALPDGERLIDPRFSYVTRGIAIYWEQLAGRWAVPGFDGADAEASMKAGTTYGQKINKIYEGLIKTMVTDADVNKYFSDDSDAEVEPEVKPDIEPNVPNVPDVQVPSDNVGKTKVNIIFDIIMKIVKAIIACFRK